MAAGDSQLSICNTALIALGQLPVLSIAPPENKRPAIMCAQLYDPTRRAMLEAAPWNCAKKQAQLSTLTVNEAVTGTADNGAGLIRLALAQTTQLSTGLTMTVSGILGTVEANGSWVITVVDATHVDLQSSAFVNPYVSGGATVTLVAPLFSYGSAYPLPADFMRFFELPVDGRARWELMAVPGVGRCLLTNVGAPLDITYIYDLQDPTQMEPLLVEVLAYALAAQLALPLAENETLKAAMEREREGRLSIARTTSAQQRSSREWEVDVLLRSRF